MIERLTFEREIQDLGIEAEAPSIINGQPFIFISVEIPGGGRIKDRTLVNPANLKTIKGYGDKDIQLHYLATKAWEALVKAARLDDLSEPLLLPTSGYRSPKTQEEGWKKAIKKYGSPEEARKWVAPPGKSAHQTGRAIDFYLGGINSSSNVGKLRMLPAHKWLVKNAGSFGFYPYKQEPWHWEYNPPAYPGIGKQPVLSGPGTTQNILSLPQQLQDAVRKGLLTMEIAFAILFGERDVNKLTNLVFYARYPDMLDKKLKRDDPRAQEWVHIRDNVIRPVLEKVSSLGSVPVAPTIPTGTDISLTKNKEQILTGLRAFTAPSEIISISDALNVMKLICQYHNIPWRLGYTILVHEGGIKLFRHKINKDGVMQTIETARKDTIPRIPRDLKLTLLGRTMSDTISDKDLDNLILTGFPDRLAIQIATGVQELKTNLERFKGYIALAFAAYNTGSGNASLVVTKGKSKKRPGGISDDEWEAMCRSAASLLHQPPINVRVGQGNWLCDPNLRTGKWIPRYGSKVYDNKSGIQLIGYQYLRSVRGCVPSQGPNSRCDWNIPRKQRKQPGSGELVCKTTRDGAMDKLYNPVKLGAYYKAAENELHPIPDDNLPVKVLNGRLVKVKDSGDFIEVAL